MIAITITLVAVVVPVAFAISGDATSGEPSADFAFSYEESAEPTVEDSFGNSSDDVNATGLVTIVFKNGNSIPTDQLEIAGGASDGLLSDSDEYGDSERLVPGEKITVWANRGTDLSILWFGDGESATLARFPIRPGGDLPVFVPEPDEDCDWVEDQLAAGTDLTISDRVVECDISGFNNIDIQNGGAVIGTVAANVDITIDDGSTYLGDVTAGNDLDVHNGASIDDSVTVGGALDVASSTIEGAAMVDGSVSVDDGTVRDGIDTDSDVTLTDSIVGSDVSAGGSIDIDGSVVRGTVSAGSNSVDLNNEAEIDGLQMNDVGSDLTCLDGDSSLVDGVGCEEYKEPDYTITVDDTNEPVEGDQLTVDVTVANTGYQSGNPDVYLYVDGTERYNWNPTINGKSTAQQTLTWSTNDGDAGTYDAVVEVDDADGNLHDSDSKEVLVANDSRTQTGLQFEIDGNENSLEIQIGDTVGYTATANFDDNSTKDVTDSANVTVVSGNASDVTIDESNNEITGDNGGTVTIEGNNTSDTDTVDLTVTPPMAGRTILTAATPNDPTATFTMENTGTKDVGITAISVNTVRESGKVKDNYKVDNDGDKEVEVEGGGSYVNTQSIEVGVDTRSFNGTAIISDGASEKFTIQEFRNNGGNRKDIDTFVFTLYFSDGTKETYDTA